jgi:hypothetical protein
MGVPCSMHVDYIQCIYSTSVWGHAVPTSWKLAGSIPDEVIGFFN